MAKEKQKDKIQDAELSLLKAQEKRENAERSKIEKEEQEVSERLNQKWWHIRLTVLLQVAIAGIVAGALIWGFALDHFINISEIIQKQQNALKAESDSVHKQLEKDRKQFEQEREVFLSNVKALENEIREGEIEFLRLEEIYRRDLEAKQADVYNLEEQLVSLQLSSQEYLDVVSAKEKAESEVNILSSELSEIQNLSKKLTFKKPEISQIEMTILLQEHEWVLSYGGSDPIEIQFQLDGKILAKESNIIVRWFLNKMTWKIEDGILIIKDPYIIATFPLSGGMFDFTYFSGEVIMDKIKYVALLQRSLMGPFIN